MPSFLAALAWLTALLFGLIYQHNEVMVVRREIPPIEREIEQLQEQLVEARSTYEAFRSPKRLLEKARHPSFGHLHPPKREQLSILRDGPSP